MTEKCRWTTWAKCWSYDIDGEMPLDDVGEVLKLSFDEEDEEDTLGGYIFSRLGRKPEEGDEVEWKNWTFTVLKMDQFRIERVKAEKTETEWQNGKGGNEAGAVVQNK